ncbi:MAG: DUF5596 domain-containing protein [Clostridia bacterium]|nr:DUF5596 domain-containing protein [Clostridia bacterium]
MYYNKEYFRQFAPKIRMSEENLDLLEGFMPRFSPEEAGSIARYLVDPSIPSAEKRERMEKLAEEENGGIYCVLIYMAAAGYTHEKYREKGMPDEVFYNTFNCLPEKMETHKKHFGIWGNVAPTWPISHLNMTLFRIGRLGYAFVPAPHEPLLAGEKVLAAEKEPYVYMHISDNEKLVGCAESIQEARAFFRKFYPEYGDCLYMTNTWLLDPRLGEILPEESNIMQFQKIFNIYDRYDCRPEVLKRVFGAEKENLDAYEPSSSLARAVIAYLKSGKELGRGLGYTKF